MSASLVGSEMCIRDRNWLMLMQSQVPVASVARVADAANRLTCGRADLLRRPDAVELDVGDIQALNDTLNLEL
eukprot:11556520-Alexandrium_andersonii.AAC.1